MGLKPDPPLGLAPVTAGLERQAAIGSATDLGRGAELLLIETKIGPAPQAQRSGCLREEPQIERISQPHLQTESRRAPPLAGAEGPEGPPRPGAEHHLGSGEGQPQHRNPLLQAGQRIKAEDEAADAGTGAIQGRGAEPRGADRQAKAAPALERPQLQRMAEHLAQLALEGRFLEGVLLGELLVEEQGATCGHRTGSRYRDPDATADPWGHPSPGILIRSACDHPGATGTGRGRNIGSLSARETPMPADPLLLLAGQWLGVASLVLAVLTIAAFLQRWGVRFRLVGITSFTVLLAISCAAFAISYTPRVSIPGAVVLPVVYDNGAELVVAAAPDDLAEAAILPSLEQISRNLRGSGRQTADGLVHVRLRQIRQREPGLSEPVILAEATRNLADGSIQLPDHPSVSATASSR